MSIRKVTPSIVLYIVIVMACAWAISWTAVFKFGFIHSNWLGSEPLDQGASFMLLLLELAMPPVSLQPLFKLLFDEASVAA